MIKAPILYPYILAILCSLSPVVFLQAQAPLINCPGVTAEIGDFSTNSPLFWNHASFIDSSIFSHNLGEAFAAIDLTAINLCSASSVLSFRYILYLDLNRDSTIETVIDSDSLPGQNEVYWGNTANHLFSGMPVAFDQRVVASHEKWGFGLSVTTTGNSSTAKVIWKDSLGVTRIPEMPYGYHRIKWIVTDSCNNTAVCEYGITVKDSKRPTVVCIAGLFLDLPVNNGGAALIYATDLLQYTEDNFTPSNQLVLACRRSGEGTGFPLTADSLPQQTLLLTCADLGLQLIELWSMDTDGNIDYCETYILVSDPANICNGPLVTPSGNIATETGEGIANVDFEYLENGASGSSLFGSQTDAFGNYFLPALPISLPPSTIIQPKLELEVLNGVNTYDLVLMHRHILGSEPLNSPYKIIAADVNKSGNITPYDIVETRRLIIGTYQEYPFNSSWRFVDKSQVFSNPQNPLADSLQEGILLNTISPLTPGNFIGCKIGDVDNTATPHFQGAPEDRNEPLLHFLLNDRSVSPGDRFTLHFDAPEKAAGFQMTLSARGLQVTRVIPGQGIGQDHFNLTGQSDRFNAVPVLTTAIETGSTAFDVECTALSSGQLSEMLQITHEITRSMAFSNSGERFGLQLNFSNKLTEPALFQNNPNPWSDRTTFQFYLPEAGNAILSVFDIHGRVVTSQTGYWPAGVHSFELRKEALGQSGVYYCRLESGTFSTFKSFIFNNF